MQRYREPETQWDQHRPPGHSCPWNPQTHYAESQASAWLPFNDGLKGIVQETLRKDVTFGATVRRPP